MCKGQCPPWAPLMRGPERYFSNMSRAAITLHVVKNFSVLITKSNIQIKIINSFLFERGKSVFNKTEIKTLLELFW